VKNNVWPTLVSDAGYDDRVFRMFFTMDVPERVPSLTHSSVPLTPSSAEKNSDPPMLVRESG
jgi:hypothetical protein